MRKYRLSEEQRAFSYQEDGTKKKKCVITANYRHERF